MMRLVYDETVLNYANVANDRVDRVFNGIVGYCIQGRFWVYIKKYIKSVSYLKCIIEHLFLENSFHNLQNILL